MATGLVCPAHRRVAAEAKEFASCHASFKCDAGGTAPRKFAQFSGASRARRAMVDRQCRLDHLCSGGRLSMSCCGRLVDISVRSGTGSL